jgi:hypothetical protein
MRPRLAATLHRSDTRLGDWYAKEVTLGKRRLVLCVNELSRLAVVLDAAPYASIPERLPAAVSVLLEGLVPSREAIEGEVAAMQTISIAKTNSRSVLRLLKEYDWLLQAMHYVDSEIQTLDPAVLSNRMCNAVTAIPPEESPRSAAIRLLSAQNE